MQRQSLTARRFYNAFYRWSVFAAQPHGASPGPRLGLSTSRRPFSHSTTVRAKKRRSSDSKTSERSREQARDRNPDRDHSRPNVPRPPPLWLTSTPASSTERPFDTLNAWEEVVRYRSSAGIMIQSAIPADIIANLEQTYGRGLQSLSAETREGGRAEQEGAHGARIEVGSQHATRITAADESVTVVSVLYSGTLQECARVRARLERGTKRSMMAARKAAGEANQMEHAPPERRTIRYHGRAGVPHSVASPQTSSAPPLRWTIGSRDRDSLPQTRARAHHQPSTTSSHPGAEQSGQRDRRQDLPITASGHKDVYSLPKVPDWALETPKTAAEVPLSSLRAFQYVVRERSPDNKTLTVETVFAPDYWMAITIISSRTQLTGGHSMAPAIREGPALPAQRVSIDDQHSRALKTEWRKSIKIHGFFEKVINVVEAIRVAGLKLEAMRSERAIAEEKDFEFGDATLPESRFPSFARLAIPTYSVDALIPRVEAIKYMVNGCRIQLEGQDHELVGPDEQAVTAWARDDAHLRSVRQVIEDVVSRASDASPGRKAGLSTAVRILEMGLRYDIKPETTITNYSKVDARAKANRGSEPKISSGRSLERGEETSPGLVETGSEAKLPTDYPIGVDMTRWARFTIPSHLKQEAAMAARRVSAALKCEYRLQTSGKSNVPKLARNGEISDQGWLFVVFWSRTDQQRALANARFREHLTLDFQTRGASVSYLAPIAEGQIDTRRPRTIDGQTADRVPVVSADGEMFRAYCFMRVPAWATGYILGRRDGLWSDKACALECDHKVEGAKDAYLTLWAGNVKDMHEGKRWIKHCLRKVANKEGRNSVPAFVALDEGIIDADEPQVSKPESLGAEDDAAGSAKAITQQPTSDVQEGETAATPDETISNQGRSSVVNIVAQEDVADVHGSETVAFPEKATSNESDAPVASIVAQDSVADAEQSKTAALSQETVSDDSHSPVTSVQAPSHSTVFESPSMTRPRPHPSNVSEKPDLMFQVHSPRPSGTKAGARKIAVRAYSTATPRNVSNSAGDTSTESEAMSTAEKLKRALRTLTHPVVLITSRVARHASAHVGEDTLDQCRGVTVSSFNTVTLTPRAIVSFNLRVPSRTWDAIRSSSRLGVNFLNATPQGAAVAHAFTQPYEHPGEPFHRLRRLGVLVRVNRDGSPKSAKFLPRFGMRSALTARLEAKVLMHECVEIGDHVIVVAEVERMILHAGEVAEVPEVDSAQGLAYAMRGYRGVGQEIEPAHLPEIDTIAKDPSDRVVEVSSTEMVERTLDSSDQQDNQDARERFAASYFEDAQSYEEHSAQVPPPSDATPSPNQPGSLPEGKRRYTTMARQRSLCLQTSRRYSRPAGPSNADHLGRSDEHIRAAVSDVKLLSSTVGDFLGTTDDPFPARPRMKAALRAQREAAQASRYLEKALADGSLTAEESSRLENVIMRNERLVAKRLALTSALDLQRMLNQGKVDFRRAQWMEKSIEKGQAVLLEQAKDLRRLLEEGRLSAERFEAVKAKLQEENHLLTTEAMRLRQMVDEEAEGGGPDDQRRFDGFKGNL